MKKPAVAIFVIVAFIIVVIAVLYFTTKPTDSNDSTNKTSDERKKDAINNDSYQKKAQLVKKLANKSVTINGGNGDLKIDGLSLGKTANQVASMTTDDIIKLLFDKGILA